ncbi:MAG TPA: AAA family ATPase [Kiritimatiellia bacterium]|nr:AAA family ATPase [Kiritimatiellia bacterium]
MWALIVISSPYVVHPIRHHHKEKNAMEDSTLISRVVLRNYKSIARCSVDLRPLVFLVGQNGAGKSNFLDALRLVTESLNTSLDHALRDRGGINEVRRRSSGHPTHFGIRLDLELPDGASAAYAFQVGAKPRGGFEVQREECHVFPKHSLSEKFFYVVEQGGVKASSIPNPPSAASDRLYLVSASGLPEFRPLYDCLTHMGFYNLNPDEIRDMQPPDSGDVLHRDGRNLASVLDKLPQAARDHVVESLARVVPGVTAVDVRHVGKKETLEFRQKVGSNAAPWRFLAENMSDGTLRALGVLSALSQTSENPAKAVRLVGIEEPEVALHPGAAGVLRDALRSASHNMQVLVTSHSPDLLDDKDISDSHILAVKMIAGETQIGPVDEVARSAIRDNLYTVGELLRLNQLDPCEQAVSGVSPRQLELFESGEC